MTKKETTFCYLLFVLPTRFELISMVPETIILSIELREQLAANIENQMLVSFNYEAKMEII